MNLPNKLTIVRAIMIPLFMCAYIYIDTVAGKWIAAALFALASFTDFLDGYLARRDNLVTDFGKFMDPLADKLMVTGALLCLLADGVIGTWVTMIILAREFIVTGIRLVGASKGRVIAAGKLGKLKTVIQIISVIAAILLGAGIITDILMYVSALITLVSGINYIVLNKDIISEC